MVSLPSNGGRKVAVRWSPGTDSTLPPVCIPNGLGSTLITIAALHDLLEARGYPVLSYDRGGVGLSQPLSGGRKTVRAHFSFACICEFGVVYSLLFAGINTFNEEAFACLGNKLCLPNMKCIDSMFVLRFYLGECP
jgi:hypothetical protein